MHHSEDHDNDKMNHDDTRRPHKQKRTRSKRPPGPGRAVGKVRGVLLVTFTLLVTFAVSNLAIYAANTYYDLDTGEIVVEEVQRVTNAIRATSGVIIGGGDGADPAAGATLEVASGNIVFSTSGTITQSGSGDVEFTGDVGIGGAPTTQEFEVADTDGSGIVAEFSGRVIGGNAVNSNEFVTLGQVDGSGGSGSIDVFVQGGNSFGELAVLGTNDTFGLSLETDGTERISIALGGDVAIASGNDFTVTSGTSNFGGDVNLTGAATRTVATTQANSSLFLSANGTGTVRLASASTGNVEFFNSNNTIDSSGNLSIAGNFTLSGLSITADGELTVSSGGAGNLILDAGSGTISVGDNALVTNGNFDLTEGTIFREVQPIFGFDVPVRCSTSCVTGSSTVTVSRTIESYTFPSAYTGSTRQHNFTIRYADSMTGGGGVSTWNVVNASTDSTITSFTVPESPSSDLDAGTVYTTDDIASLPEDGTDWYLEVSVPTGETIQVYQVFLGAYDEID